MIVSQSSKLISLGFSCISRQSISMVSADFRSFPFDYIIATKQFILDSLRSDGLIFQNSYNDCEIFEKPGDRLMGVYSKGAYYWHDYQRDGFSLKDGWKEDIEKVNGKYAALWRRFSHVVRDSSIKKTFVIANSQSDLRSYTTSMNDYIEKFSITTSYVQALCGALNEFGAKNFSMTLMFRTLADFSETYNGTFGQRDCLHYRYTGMMLPPGTHVGSTVMALSVLATNRGDYAPRIADIVGTYENGRQIFELATGGGILYCQKNGVQYLCAEISVYGDAYIFAFEAEVKTAVLEDQNIRFSDNSVWRRC